MNHVSASGCIQHPHIYADKIMFPLLIAYRNSRPWYEGAQEGPEQLPLAGLDIEHKDIQDGRRGLPLNLVEHCFSA